MRPRTVALVALFLAIAASHVGAQIMCEDRNGHMFWSPGPPTEPCFTPGTWDRLFGEEHRREQRAMEKDLAARSPEFAREIRCRDCLLGHGSCRGIAEARCWEEINWAKMAADLCRDCKQYGARCDDAREFCPGPKKTKAQAAAVGAVCGKCRSGEPHEVCLWAHQLGCAPAPKLKGLAQRACEQCAMTGTGCDGLSSGQCAKYAVTIPVH